MRGKNKMDKNISDTANLQIHTVSIARPNPGDPAMDAYMASPDGAGPFPGVVIIHEIFGLNDNIRDIARRFARAGYAALAIDLFSGRNRVACMFRIFNGIMFHSVDNSIVGELRAAIDYLRAQTEVDSKRIGVIGFCMGGSYALQLSIADDKLRAASVFYGQNPKPLEAVAKACPIVGNYPEKDFTANAARELEPMLEKYNVPHDIKIYPGAQHSFFNDQRANYNAEAAADAWQRTLIFFEKYLKEK
jgi:carboxymethylenebutenolidase